MQLFIDTETTGFARNGVQPRIVSIAWIMADNPETAAIRKYLVVRPEGFTIPAPAAAVHGITTAKAMKAGKPLGQVLGDLATDIGQFAPRHLVAHNAAYDLPVIAAEYARLDRRNPCSTWPRPAPCAWPGETWPGERPSWSTSTAACSARSFAGAHNASADTLACAKIYFGMTRPAASRGQPGAGGQAMSSSSTEQPAGLPPNRCRRRTSRHRRRGARLGLEETDPRHRLRRRPQRPGSSWAANSPRPRRPP